MSFLFARRPERSAAASEKATTQAEDAGAEAQAREASGDAATESNKPRKTHRLILTPPADIEIPPRPPLSNTQQARVDEIRAYVVELHGAGLAEDDPYYAFEETWVHEDYLPERYLIATGWDVAAAKTRIRSTLEWRRSFQPECISPDEVKPEALTGKHFISGFDKQGRPIFTVCPRHENTKNYDQQLRYMVWSFERCIQLMPTGVTQLNLVMSLEGNNAANNPPMSSSRTALNIMQGHYPCRLARAICNRGPWFFSVFFRIISPFIDPVTRQKIFFNPNMTSFANNDQVTTEWEGGEYDYEWDFESYWSQMLDYCGLNPDGSRVQGPVPVDKNKELGPASSGSKGQATATAPATAANGNAEAVAPAHATEETVAPSGANGTASHK
ncbi:hypothetical protein OC834_003280 [Tilletia horrida]|nr:hypothetical protein OC834_003280 [Tilletia horrida]KAK0565266.1 hypothetical protein OC844_001304 [Tilletia horrida]